MLARVSDQNKTSYNVVNQVDLKGPPSLLMVGTETGSSDGVEEAGKV
jgi:hypothetical protein